MPPDQPAPSFARSPSPSARPNKGKARASSLPPTERSPLLPGPSRASSRSPSPPRHRPRSTTQKLLIALLVTLASAVLLLGALALLAWSYARAAQSASPEQLASSLVVRGPEHVAVLNLTEPSPADPHTTIVLAVQARAGVDAGAVLGVSADEDDQQPDGLFTYFWKCLGRAGVRALDRVTVRVEHVQLRDGEKGWLLADVRVRAPFEVALAADPPAGDGWLERVEMEVEVRPTMRTDDLVQFARRAWSTGVVAVEARADAVEVRGGGIKAREGWRARVKAVQEHVGMKVRKQVPAIPGMPAPGHDAPLPDLAKLVTLTSFNLTSSNGTLTISALATAPNPIPSGLTFTPPSLPFLISLPAANASLPAVPLAAVHTLPFGLTHPNLTLPLAGTLLPFSRSSLPSFALFLRTYLAGQPSPILISTPLYPSLALPAEFPAPVPKPRVLRDVALRELRLKPAGNKWLASGEVHVRVVLPRGFNIRMDVKAVLPDVLIFDGRVPPAALSLPRSFPSLPGRQHARAPPPDPLPDPLPPRAFARVRPEDWLPATSVPYDTGEPGDGAAVAVSAKFEDVPFEVLPGRDKAFRDFVSKVVFGSGGALAGLRGTVAVSARMDGLGEDALELTGLPFEGEVRVGHGNI